jgi:hypothetical protein
MPAFVLAYSTAQTLLSCAVTLAIITAIIAINARHHGDRLARLRRLLTPPRTAGDTEPTEVPQTEHATGAPPSAQAPAAAVPPRPPTPPLAGMRYAADTFALVAEHVDHTQRLAVAEARVEQVLAALPSDRWVVQRFALVAGHRIPFLVLGETGVFALWAIGWRPQWTDPAFVSTIAANLNHRLPTYPGPVNTALCGTIQSDIEPRFWYRSGDGGGAWILGIDWLIRWMEHFGHQHGLGTDDISHFRAISKPDWTRPVAPVPPGIPIINTTGNAE